MVSLGNKVKVVCPNCNKGKYDVVYKDGKLIGPKGAKPSTMIKQISESSWEKDWRIGIAALCKKCKKAFYLYDIDEQVLNLSVETGLREGLIVPWFCQKCKHSFIDPSMTCPSCGTSY